nr:putative reverse transcriptase domain-containing protein [Tanacetum cinerariifolium]
MHKAFPLPGESSHWRYKFPLPVKGVPTARRMEIPLPGVCTAMMKKLPKILILVFNTFMNGKPRSFNRTEGVVGLRCWIKKVEQVFEICKCAEDGKVMFAASTFDGRALTWWNGNIHTLGLVNANNIPWNKFKTMLTPERQETTRAYAAAPTEGHYKNKCPKGRNQLNKVARGRAYVVDENPQQNPNVVTGTFLLNDHYPSVFFYSGAEKSFVSTAFTPFIGIAPATLETSYEVELADGKVIVYIPLPNGKILEIQGERPKKDPKSLSCIKTDEKKPEYIRIVRDFPERGKVIAYASRQLKIHEKNYITHDLELDSLSRKERLKQRRVRAMSITIHYGLKIKILEAQGEASKDLKSPTEWLRGLETYFKRRDGGDRVLLKVFPWKGMVRFSKKGKLAPRYVGPFEIVKRVGLKCLAEPDVQVPLEDIKIDENLHFVKEPIEIVDRDVNKLTVGPNVEALIFCKETSAVRLNDQDDPHDDAHPEGQNGEKSEPSTLTSGNHDQFDDFDFWTNSYATDDYVLLNEKVSQELVDEMSQIVDEAKLRKVVNEMLRQQCTSGDEHRYHIDQMQNFLKSDTVWESKKEIIVPPYQPKPTLLVQSCQRDPKAPTLSLSYNNEVKYGYVTHKLSKEDVEYLQLFAEEIEERLKYRDQMRRWEMEAFTRVPNQYKEYLFEFWYTAKALKNWKVWFLTPTSGILGEVGVNTFSAIRENSCPTQVSMLQPFIETVRQWFPTIGYREAIEAKDTLKKSLLLPRWKKDSKGKNHGAKFGDRKKPTFSKHHHLSKIKATKGTNLSVLVDKTKSVRDGLKTVHTKIDSPKDDEPIIIHDEDKEEVHAKKGNAEKSHRQKTETQKTKAKAEVAFLSAQPSYPNVEQLTKLLELPAEFLPTPGQVSSIQANLKTLDALLSLLNKATEAFNSPSKTSSQPKGDIVKKNKGKKAMANKETKEEESKIDYEPAVKLTSFMVESSKKKKLKKIKESVKVEMAKKEEVMGTKEIVNLLGIDVVTNVYKAMVKYDKYYDKMLNRRVQSRIRNYDVLTRKGPITQKTRMEDVHEQVLEISFNKPLGEQGPLNKLNKLAKKKRKHADAFQDYFMSTK